jgi:hypothetical protein
LLANNAKIERSSNIDDFYPLSGKTGHPAKMGDPKITCPGKGPLDGHASNHPEFPTMDGKADNMIAGRHTDTR